MKITQSHLIAFSPCGNTLTSLKFMASNLPSPINGHNLTLPANRKTPLHFGPEDLAVIAFPVYGGRLPRIADEVFAVLNGDNTPAVLVVTYGNRDYEDALLEMQELATARGFVPFAALTVIAEHAIQPKIGSGRPDTMDIASITSFTIAINKIIRECPSIGDISFTAPGEKPFRRKPLTLPFHPEADDKCVFCGLCAEKCPAGAIPEDAPNTTIQEKCITCTSCIQVCPVEARSITSPMYDNARALLLQKHMERRPVEIFFCD